MPLGRKVYKLAREFLAYQDRLIDSTYTRPFLRQNINPGVRKGIKRGLGGGTAFSPFFRANQYIDDITEMPSGTRFSQVKTSYNRFSKARSRFKRRPACRNYKYDRRGYGR